MRRIIDRGARDQGGQEERGPVGDRNGSREEPGDASCGPPLRDELSRTTLTWGDRDDAPAQKVFLSICDTPGTLCCELWADTRFVSPADMAALLRRLESVLVDAVLGGTGQQTHGER